MEKISQKFLVLVLIITLSSCDFFKEKDVKSERLFLVKIESPNDFTFLKKFGTLRKSNTSENVYILTSGFNEIHFKLEYEN